MGSFTQKHNAGSTFLAYDVGPEDVVDFTCLSMLTNNSIPNLMDTTISQIDENKTICYNITGKLSVASQMERPMEKKTVLEICESIANALTVAGDYLLPEEEIILDSDYIYSGVGGGEAMLCCLPVKNHNAPRRTLPQFFMSFLMSVIAGANGKDINYTAPLVQYLQNEQNFSLEGFRKELQKAAKSGALVYEAERQPRIAYPDPGQPAAGSERGAKDDWRQPPAGAVPPRSIPQGGYNAPSADRYAGDSIPPVDDGIPSLPETKSGKKDKGDGFGIGLFKKKEKAPKQEKPPKSEKPPKAEKPPKPPKQEKAGRKEKRASFQIPGEEMDDESYAPVPPVPPAPPSPPLQPPSPTPPAPPSPPAAPASPYEAEERKPGYYTPPIPQPEPVKAYTPPQSNPMYPDTDDDDGTREISDGLLEMYPYVIRKRTRERVVIDRNPFIIGRGEGSDYSISDNRSITHQHAYIIQHDDQFYIVDMRSKNKTWRNAEQCTPGEEYLLSYGDTIRLADEQFEFILT